MGLGDVTIMDTQATMTAFNAYQVHLMLRIIGRSKIKDEHTWSTIEMMK